jgi:hypothetical protein
MRKVQPGDVFSRTSYGTVVKQTPAAVIVKNDLGFEWCVDASVFEEEFTIATYFSTEVTVNQTNLIEIINKNPRVATTINFRKKVNPATVTKQLREFLLTTSASKKKFATAVRESLAGESRTMIGRHFCDYDERGRLRFIEHGKGLRLVDPRTVEFAIINDTKYVI